MGLTAEAVAGKFKVSREDQDAFAFRSHQNALRAIAAGYFKEQIVPVTVKENYYDPVTEKKRIREFTIEQDEGPRADTAIEVLAGLKPVFAKDGSVTAGNSSQTSDGAAFVMVVSESFLKAHNLTPQ